MEVEGRSRSNAGDQPPKSRFWVLLSVWVIAIVAILGVGGALNGVLASPISAASQSTVNPATISVTLPPSSTASLDLPPIEPVPDSTVIPAGVRAPHPEPPSRTLAVDLLGRLPIKAALPKTGYSRAQFGPAWPDVDHNGCDTRNDILRRDLSNVAFADGSTHCVVRSGELSDPYTGNKLAFDRSKSAIVQIDQVVSLSDAWQKGGQKLTEAQKLAFANDPLNLMAVETLSTISKGSKDASSWLPSNSDYRCYYVARQISVKATYGLWVTQTEHDVLGAVLRNCPGIFVPTDDSKPHQPGIQIPDLSRPQNSSPSPVSYPAESGEAESTSSASNPSASPSPSHGKSEPSTSSSPDPTTTDCPPSLLIPTDPPTDPPSQEPGPGPTPTESPSPTSSTPNPSDQPSSPPSSSPPTYGPPPTSNPTDGATSSPTSAPTTDPTPSGDSSADGSPVVVEASPAPSASPTP
ncbi:DUF1524 domain-containing protein [Psychromicrobium sp. YIM B11713]|uniref:HNH endonuclease family protein n=1 Tax=Psychromicrobium sp. YIM B11713 TaxID=3145233 RepID=UPI00374F9EE7